MKPNLHSTLCRARVSAEARTPARRALATSALVMTAALALTGCASGNAARQAEPQDTNATEQQSAEASTDTQPGESGGKSESNAPAQGSATVTLTGQSFTFTPSTCIIDDDEVLVIGPGADDDSGDLAYLDIDVYALSSDTAGEVRITLGTDQPFVTTDDFLVAFLGDPHEYGIGAGSGQLQVDGTFRMNGEAPIGAGTVLVDCN